MSERGLLYATVVRMVARHEGYLPATHGHQAHGAFLDIIQATAPEVAEQLHAGGPYQPFTVSPLRGLSQPVNGSVRVGAGQEVWLRFTLLDSALFALVTGRFMRDCANATVRIGGLHFEVTEILTTPGSHPRAGYTVIGNLLDRWRDTTDPLPDMVTLRFLSPTALRVGKWPNGEKRFLLWPEPERVWYGLRRLWGAFGGPDPGQDYNQWVADCVSVVAYRLQTRMLEFPKHPQAGFVGWATFRAHSQDHERLALWRALADFAFYAGVGDQRTMGMGQAVSSTGVCEDNHG